jgi:uncharacterized protein YfkK (UPF0435 family)
MENLKKQIEEIRNKQRILNNRLCVAQDKMDELWEQHEDISDIWKNIDNQLDQWYREEMKEKRT